MLSAALFGALFLLSGELVLGQPGVKTAVCLLVALGAGVALFRTACTQTNPMAPIDLLRMPSLRTSYIASICAFSGQMTGLVALPFYLQSRFGQVAIGLIFTGFPLGVVLGAPISGRLSDRLSPGPLGLIGLMCFAFGYLLLSLNGGGSTAWIVISLIVAGFGMGLFQSPNNRLMLSEAPPYRTGAAAGMTAVCRLLGQTIGVLVAAVSFRLVGTTSWIPFVIAAAFGFAGAFASAVRTGRVLR